jgi:hypothetical protein
MTTGGANVMAGHDGTQCVSFYFSAHLDDWQLFMNPPAFHDVLDDNTKCIFIHITAGDAGLGTSSAGRKHPFYLARENGAESAIRFMADSDNRPPVEEVASTMAFDGHPIHRVNYRNTVAYFLRLPDGNPGGTGYADTGYQSLKRLADGQIDRLSAIDGTTAYHGWKDLVATVRSVIDFERGLAPSVQLNVPESDPVINPNDHSDHYMTAKAALDAAEGLTGVRRLHYVGYASVDRPENLSGQDRDMKCAVYSVTLTGVLALDHPAGWQHYDQTFVGRNYFRVEGGGTFGLLAHNWSRLRAIFRAF